MMKFTLGLLVAAPLSVSLLSVAWATDMKASAPAQVPAVAVDAAAKTDKTLAVEGPIAKVVARKKEIYVQGPDRKYEFYFTPKTTLTKEGAAVDFSTLTEGMKVRVTARKVGKRMDPVTVEVLP